MEIKNYYETLEQLTHLYNDLYNENLRFKQMDLEPKPTEEGMKSLKEGLEDLRNSKIFFIESDIKDLLLLTDNKISERKIPFNNTFIETELVINNFKISGLLLNYSKGDKLGLIIHFLSADITKQTDMLLDNCIFLTDINDKYSQYNKFRDKSYFYIYKKIRLFFCNFLDFLNNPETQLVNIERTELQNKKRIIRGKLPIPSYYYVRLTGKLKIYLNQLQSNGHLSYNHRFWVRGHFRTLRNEKRYGDRVGTRVWIVPYIKGQGILVNKMYDVKNTQPDLTIA